MIYFLTFSLTVYLLTITIPPSVYSIVFNRLWDTMKRKGISQYALIHTYHISESRLTRLRKKEIVKIEILSKLCSILDCPIEEICEFEKDTPHNKESKE